MEWWSLGKERYQFLYEDSSVKGALEQEPTRRTSLGGGWGWAGRAWPVPLVREAALAGRVVSLGPPHRHLSLQPQDTLALLVRNRSPTGR